MLDDYSRDDLAFLSPIILGLGVIVSFLLWYLSYRVRGRQQGALLWICRFMGFLLAAFAFWFFFQLVARFCALATSWPLIVVALLGGAAVEIIAGFYDFEKSIVSKKRGRALLLLRLFALLVLLVILVQPVHSFLEDREINREIAVLVDDSDSMQLSDQRLTVTEVLDRAEIFEVAAVEKRPRLHEVHRLAAKLRSGIQSEINGIVSAPSPDAGLANRAEQLPAFLDRAELENQEVVKVLNSILNLHNYLPGDIKAKLEEYLRRTRDGVARIFEPARSALTSANGEEVLRHLRAGDEELDAMFQTLEMITSRADEAWFGKLNEVEKKHLNDFGARPRLELALKSLQSENANLRTKEGIVEDPTLLGRLREQYNLRLYRFSRDVEELSDLNELQNPSEQAEAERVQTDLSGALEYVLENSSPESLAGVLLLSDGRHNGAQLPEDGLRQLAVQGSPISAIPVGGSLGPIDISLLNLNSPESIFLDDRVVISAEAKFDGLLGKKVKAELLANGEVVSEQVVNVSDVSYRSELRFVHTPADKGILDYELRLEADEREIFKNNNAWEFKVAVTDDRTNVLLVDGFPRWEFRYLRNLFYGRDKSVHLQYVLLNPDRIDRGTAKEPVAASATRKFGDAEATMLPSSVDEWKLFDVIILGDIPANALSFREWKAIEESVTRRGALLVCVAGPRHMPHGHDSDVLANLLPIQYSPGRGHFSPPESSYRIQLTGTGRGHSVTSQSTSRSLNAERWQQFPNMSWRFAPDGVKEGAEILAYALPEGGKDGGALGSNLAGNHSPDSVEAAIERLANQKKFEAENSLITIMRAGLGKVVMMNFDQTWRFRYGVGDTFHHRFWGQLTRWGAGKNLRSGNEIVRLGTDRLSYTPSDAIQIHAKVLDADRRPITDAEVFASIWYGDRKVTQQKMSYLSESSGMYETTVSGLSEEGEYTVRLEGERVDVSLEEFPSEAGNLSTKIIVVKTRNPVELAELTADRDFLNRATGMTGGEVAELWDLDRLLDGFGAPREVLTERRNVTLWDTWPMLLLFLGTLTTEWILRRRSGLV